MMNNLFEDFPFFLMPEQQKLPRTINDAAAITSPNSRLVENVSSSINQDFPYNLSTPLFSRLNTDSGSPLIGDNVSLDASSSLFYSPANNYLGSEYINNWFNQQPSFDQLNSPSAALNSMMNPLNLGLTSPLEQAMNGGLPLHLPTSISNPGVALFSPTIRQLLAAHQENMKLNLKIRHQLAKELLIQNCVYAPISTPVVDGKDPGSTYLYDIDTNLLANSKVAPIAMGEPLVNNLNDQLDIDLKSLSNLSAQTNNSLDFRDTQTNEEPLINPASSNPDFYKLPLSNLDVLNAAKSTFNSDPNSQLDSAEYENQSDSLFVQDENGSKRKADPIYRRFPCEFPGCNLKFTRKFNLKTHEYTHNPDRVKKFECDLCPKRFDRKHDLNRHQGKMHFSLPKYQCPRCEVRIKKKPLYRAHLRECLDGY